MSDLRDHLTQIPDLFTQLALFRVAGSRPKDPDARSAGKPGSRPPTDLDVLDLEDARTKRDADLYRDDYENDQLAGNRRQGILPTLSAWVRKTDAGLWEVEEHHEPPSEEVTVVSECSFLLDHLLWIEAQEWAPKISRDIAKMVSDLKRVTTNKDVWFTCPKCANPAFIENSMWLVCTEVEAHKSTVRSLEMEYRRRPPITTMDVMLQFGVTDDLLHQWRRRGKIEPVEKIGRTQTWWPWDVLRLMNPELAEAIDARDRLGA